MRKAFLLPGKQGSIRKIWSDFPEGELKNRLRLLLSPASLDHRIEMPEVMVDNDLSPKNYQPSTDK